MFKHKVLICTLLILTVVLVPTSIALAKGGKIVGPTGGASTYSLTINKTNPSINQTVRIKLNLKVDGKKAQSGLVEHIDILSDGGVVIATLDATTNSSGKARWTFKFRDITYAVPGSVFTIKCYGENGTGTITEFGSFVVTIR